MMLMSVSQQNVRFVVYSIHHDIIQNVMIPIIESLPIIEYRNIMNQVYAQHVLPVTGPNTGYTSRLELHYRRRIGGFCWMVHDISIYIAVYFISFHVQGCPSSLETLVCYLSICHFVIRFTIFPFDNIKSRQQASTTKSSFIETASTAIRDGGIRSVYKGCLPCVLRGFPANGALFFTVELTKKVFHHFGFESGSSLGSNHKRSTISEVG